MTDASRRVSLDPSLDIAGTDSVDQASNLDLSDEPLGLGTPIPGQSGSTSSIIAFDPVTRLVTIVGLTGITPSTSESIIQIIGSGAAGNDGAFTIINYNSATSVDYLNPAGVAPDPNNGSIMWIQRNPYTLADDLNYERTDRTDIKGVQYYDPVPTYVRPDATNVDVPANLSNIAGKTTDAVAYPGSRELYGLPVMAGQSKILVSDPGQLKHIDPIDTLGVPCFDVAPFVGDFKNCFVKVLDGYSTGIEFTVISGPHAGERIFGVTNNGSSASPDSMEVVFYSCPLESDFTLFSSPYTWEVGQTNLINIIYGYNQRADSFDFNIFRLPVTIPIVQSGTGQFLTPFEHQTLRQLIHFIDEGPGDGFISGAYKVTTPSPAVFPTSIIWYEDDTMTKIIVSKTIVWSGVVPITITWQVYNTDGVTVAHTVSDSITYTNNIFESTRTRTIS